MDNTNDIFKKEFGHKENEKTPPNDSHDYDKKVDDLKNQLLAK